MAVENTKYIAGLNASLPTGNDPKSQGDDHLRLLKTVLQQVFAGFPGEVVVAGSEAAGATVNDYVVTVTPALTAYAANTLVAFRSTHENTGAATIRVSGLSEKSLLSPQGTILRAKTLTANTWALAAYDGTNFRLLTANSQAFYDYVDQTAFSTALPQQVGNGGSVLRTDGISAKWGAPFPSGVLAAVSDGVVNADSAFAALEAGTVGQEIDLGGKTFVVTARPTKNNYVNGVFKESGNTRLAASFKTVLVPRPHVSYFGGQLRALKDELTDPVTQQTTISFWGDSRTWGSSLPENAVDTPRSGTLADARDNYASDSWVNQFKRHIGATYFDNVAPELSNWSFAVSGQSTATFKKTVKLYPGKQGDSTSPTGVARMMKPFTDPVVTGGGEALETTSAPAVFGYLSYLRVGSSGATASITFPFTGNSFSIVYARVPGEGANVKILVNDVQVDSFNSDDGTLVYGNRKVVTLAAFARGATVKILVEWPAGASNVRSLRMESIELTKTCTIVNQGIKGTTAYNYAYYNFGGGTGQGPTIVTPDLGFVFVDLGTNDRAISAFTSRSQPPSVNSFRRNLENVIDKGLAAQSALKFILMNGPPAANESPTTYAFTMQDVRAMVRAIAKSRSFDHIDNYAPFLGLDLNVSLPDGLHEGLLGHSIHNANNTGALEQA